ncbi:hypothetical protein CDV31_016825 [Fusarium ambrosium]|uniref:Uncharacterized protein n=1 Tax=Fusarium ambrosium TaxID=131363 RepID=A0A428S0X5_9HYPO|nr:hypothetical protein CDV31_016825 [Fusarium ambrosium]
MPLGMREHPLGAYLDYVPDTDLVESNSRTGSEYPFYSFTGPSAPSTQPPESFIPQSIFTQAPGLSRPQGPSFDFLKNPISDYYRPQSTTHEQYYGQQWARHYGPKADFEWGWNFFPHADVSDTNAVTFVFAAEPGITVKTSNGVYALNQSFVAELSENVLSLRTDRITFSYRGETINLQVIQQTPNNYLVGPDGVYIRAIGKGLVDLVHGPDDTYWMLRKRIGNNTISLGGDMSPSLTDGKSWVINRHCGQNTFVTIGGTLSPSLDGKFIRVDKKVRNGLVIWGQAGVKKTWGEWFASFGIGPG